MAIIFSGQWFLVLLKESRPYYFGLLYYFLLRIQEGNESKSNDNDNIESKQKEIVYNIH